MRQGEQERDRRRLCPLPHRRRPDRRETDQHVHVEAEVAQRRQRARPHPPQPDDDGEGVGGNRPRRVRVAEGVLADVPEDRLAPGVGGRAVDQPAEQHEHAAGDEVRRRGAQPQHPGGRGRRHRLDGQSGAGDGLAHPCLGGVRRIDGQVDAAVDEVEADVDDAGIGFDGPAHQRHFVGTVHGRHAQVHVDERGGAGGRGHGRARARPSRCAGANRLIA